MVWFLLGIYLGKGPEWAKKLKSEGFELICPDSPDRTFKYDEFAKCKLATVPAHAVITRKDVREDVVSFLKAAQVSSLQFCVDFSVDLSFLLSQILYFIFCDVETGIGR